MGLDKVVREGSMLFQKGLKPCSAIWFCWKPNYSFAFKESVVFTFLYHPILPYSFRKLRCCATLSMGQEQSSDFLSLECQRRISPRSYSPFYHTSTAMVNSLLLGSPRPLSLHTTLKYYADRYTTWPEACLCIWSSPWNCVFSISSESWRTVLLTNV